MWVQPARLVLHRKYRRINRLEGCCIDRLSRHHFTGCGKAILGFVVPIGLCTVMQPLRAKYTCTVPPDINVTLSHNSDIPFPIN
jgi:hypothetical protein